MIVVLAHDRDAPAHRLVEIWSAHGARLMTPADLSRPGWTHYLGDPGREVAVVSGQAVPVESFTGVVTRIPGITPDDLPHVVEDDRPYVAAEMTAFLTAWLSSLPCPVINRPATNSLMGAPHASEGWAALAARAGLRLPWTRRVFPSPAEIVWPTDAVTVSVLGDRCFGDVDPALAAQACRLGAAAGVELLAVMFSHPRADAAFLGAHLWPDVASAALAAALLARLVRAAPGATEAGA
jgi:hypothetical protein